MNLFFFLVEDFEWTSLLRERYVVKVTVLLVSNKSNTLGR